MGLSVHRLLWPILEDSIQLPHKPTLSASMMLLYWCKYTVHFHEGSVRLVAELVLTNGSFCALAIYQTTIESHCTGVNTLYVFMRAVFALLLS